MNKFHQEIFRGHRRLPELADRKNKGQRAVITGNQRLWYRKAVWTEAKRAAP